MLLFGINKIKINQNRVFHILDKLIFCYKSQLSLRQCNNPRKIYIEDEKEKKQNDMDVDEIKQMVLKIGYGIKHKTS